MAQVQKVELDIKRQSSSLKGTTEITVRSTLSFSLDELGKDFKLKIALYGAEQAESATEENPAHQPLYLFLFSNPPMILPKRDYTVIHPITPTLLHEETRLIPVGVLDEDPGVRQTQHLILPIPDKIYAVVNLSTEEHSNTIELVYAPIPAATGYTLKERMEVPL